ncbi:MAG: methionyl-tRNA formyltransferase [Prolixibacteraceae bacterium]|nr:methionyl-tRNA formyltransferase [Prolixibacteraceae bacterium]
MGTPEFAVESLRKLLVEGYNVVGVVTAPDKPSGRGQQLSESAVKKYAIANGLKLLQPEKLKASDFLNELETLKADLQIVVAFRMLPVEVWNMPPLGTFNLHASLLPKYRGAAPLNWAIINGEKESGVTTFKLQHEIDTGSIIFQEKVDIDDNDDVEILHDKLILIGAELVLKTVDALAEGNVEYISQEYFINKGIEPCAAPKIFKEDCMINWEKDSISIKNLVRGLSPYPAAWTILKDKSIESQYNVKIFSVGNEIVNDSIEPGQIFSDGKKYLKFRCEDGYIYIKELQFPGKKRMLIDEFLRGFQISKFI